MKLHLPTKLRASLIAAVIAVSASVYNATAATQIDVPVTEVVQNNTYTAVSGDADNDAISIKTTIPVPGVGYVTNVGGNLGFVTDGTFHVSNSMMSTDGFHGSISVQADKIIIDKDTAVAESHAVLENASVAGYMAAAPTSTQIALGSRLYIINGSTAGVDDIIKLGTLSSKLGEYGDKNVNLGNVTGQGGLTIVGNGSTGDHVDAVVGNIASGVATERFGLLSIANAKVSVGGVQNATTVALDGSDVTSTGAVSTLTLKTKGSSLTAANDITVGVVAGVAGDAASTDVQGSLVSNNGNITLVNGSVHTGSSLNAANGTISLSQIAVDGATSIITGQDLDLESSSIANSTGIAVGNDLLLNKLTGEAASSVTNSTITSVGRDIKAVDGATVDHATVGTVGRNIEVTSQSTIRNNTTVASVAGYVKVNHSSVAASSINNISGAITVENDSTVENSHLLGVGTGAATISSSTVTGSEITTGTGDATISNSTVTGSQIATGTGDVAISGSTVQTNSTVSTTNGAVGITGTSTITASQVTGSNGVTISDSTVQTNSTVSATNGAVGITDSTITASKVSTGTGAVTISNSTVQTNSTVSATSGTVGITGSTIDGSTVSTGAGTVTVTNSTVKANSHVTATTGNIVLTGGDTTQAIGTPNDRARMTSFTATGAYLLNGSTTPRVLSTVSLRERNGNETQSFKGKIQLAIYDGATLLGTTDFVDMQHNDAIKTFTFGETLELDPAKTYTFKFLKEDGSEATIALRTMNGTSVLAAGQTAWGPVLGSESYGNVVLGSTISTGDGALDVDNTYIEGSTITAQHNGTVDSSEVVDSTISVTDTTDGSLQVTGSSITGASHVTAGTTATIKGGSKLALDGGETDNAALAAANLVLQDIDSNAASLSHASLTVGTETKTNGNNTLDLDDVQGGLGNLTQAAGTGTAAQVNITGASTISAGAISTEGAADTTGNADSYFGGISVDDSSALTVTGKALVKDFSIEGTDSTAQFNADAWLTSAGIDASSVSVAGNAHIGTLTLANDSTLNVTGTSHVANIAGTKGTINVVNGSLKTPVVNAGDLTLGLSGGTVIVGAVAAADGATVASTAAANAHVHVAAITDAGQTGTPAQSTIKTAGNLDKVTGYAGGSEGDSETRKVNMIPFLVTGEVTINGQDFHDGDRIVLPDIIADTQNIPQLGDKNVGVVNVLTPEVRSKLLELSELTPVLDDAGVQQIDEDGRLLWQSSTSGVVNGLTVVYPDAATEITYYPSATGTNGTMGTVSDGIASLQVDGDFGASNTIVKAYELGKLVGGVVTPDATTGLITVGGKLTGQGNSLVGDKAVAITGQVTGSDNTLTAGTSLTTGAIAGSGNTLTAGTTATTGAISGQGNSVTGEQTVTVAGITTTTAGTETVHNTLTSNHGNVDITDAVKDSHLAVTATEGSVAVNGKLTGSDNTLTAGTTVETRDIEGSSNTLTAAESVTTGGVKGDSNSLTAGTTVETGAIEGGSNTLAATESVTTGNVKGNGNTLTAGTTVEAGAITGNGNTLTAGTTVETGAITGNNNTLTASTATDTTGVTVTGAIKGDGNTLTADNSAISAKDIAGNGNTLTAGTDVTVDGTLSGEGNTVTATQGDVQIGTLAGVEGDVDSTKTNTISATNGKVTITSLADSNTVTNVTAGQVELGSGSAANMTISSAADLTIGGDVALTDSTITAATITGTNGTLSLTTTDGPVAESQVAGDVTLKGLTIGEDARLLVVGSVEATEITVSGNGHLDAFKVVVDDLTMIGENAWIMSDDVTVNRNLSLQDGAALKNASLTLTDVTEINVTGNSSLESEGSLSKDDATLNVEDGGNVTLAGALEVAELNVSGADAVKASTVTVGGDINVDGGDVTSTNGSVAAGGDITIGNGGSLTSANNGTVTAGGDIEVTDGSIHSSDVTLNGELTLISDKTAPSAIGNVTGATNATLQNVTMGDFTDLSGSLTATDSTIGSVTTANGAPLSSVDLDNTTVGSGLTTSGTAMVADSQVDGKLVAKDASLSGLNLARPTSVAGAEVTDALVTNGVVVSTDDVQAGSLEVSDGALSVNGDLTVTDGDLTVTDAYVIADAIDVAAGVTVTYGDILGNITGATSASITDGSIDDLTMAGGTVTLTNAETGNVSGADSTDVLAGSNVASLSTADLTVAEDATLKALTGDVTANGALDIAGSVVAEAGSISLTGTDGSITGTVSAKNGNDVNLGGTITATGATISGESINVDGTLNVADGTALAGKVTGHGTLNLNKADGTSTTLANGTNMHGGRVNVNQGTLNAEHNAHVGTLTVAPNATVEIGGEGAFGDVNADSVKLASGAKMVAEVDLTHGLQDRLISAGTVDMGGNALTLNSVAPAGEAAVADGAVIQVIRGNVTGVNMDVDHNLDTLNAHMAANGDVVLSKNYKVAGETNAQKRTAAAIASMPKENLSPNSDMSAVLDALNHTRSAQEARTALDSLSGAELAGVHKLVTDETAEHMRLMRSTMHGLAADVHYQPATCCGMPSYSDNRSSAIAGSVTGGTSEVSGSGSLGKYTRSSVGFMLATAHALSKDWTFGADVAASIASASCGDTDIDATAFYLDAALMNRTGRLAQTITLGLGVFDIDTERKVSVSASGAHGFAGKAEGSTQATVVNFSYEAVYDLVSDASGNRLSVVGLGEGSMGQIDDMEETGMGNAGLQSEYETVASLTIGAGLRYTHEYESYGTPGYFTVEGMLVADAGDRTPKVNNTFIAGGSSFRLDGPDSGSVGARVNAGVLIPVDNGVGIFGNVTTELRADETFVGGNVGLKFEF